MKEGLLKLLEEKVEVTDLSEGNIAEYVQAVQTIAAINKFVIEPFKDAAKRQGEGKIYEGKDVVVKATRKVGDIKHSDKEIVTLYEGTLENMERNNENNRIFHGVKRFNGEIGIDAQYINMLLDIWQDQVLGEKVNEGVSITGKGVNQVVNDHKGRLVFTDQKILRGTYWTRRKIGEESALLYVAGDKQIKLLKKRIISPFETVFKEQAKTSKKRTVFDNKQYGGLIVQVKSVPRVEPNYKTVINSVMRVINKYSRMNPELADGAKAFNNYALNDPRIYIALSYLQDQVERVKSKSEEAKMRQEVNILYAPEKTTILSTED